MKATGNIGRSNIRHDSSIISYAFSYIAVEIYLVYHIYPLLEEIKLKSLMPEVQIQNSKVKTEFSTVVVFFLFSVIRRLPIGQTDCR
jgi:hypothetical protein